MKKNLILTGMMGVGKTTVGKTLAERLSYSFIDVDRLIEYREGCRINIIFKNKGESYFRKIETEITLKELKKSKTVISLGGGSFLNKIIRNKIKKNSISFWLDLSIEKIVQRLKKTNKRPLLFKKNIAETVKKIYLERRRTYNEADFRINCNSLQSNEIVDKIIKYYEVSTN